MGGGGIYIKTKFRIAQLRIGLLLSGYSEMCISSSKMGFSDIIIDQFDCGSGCLYCSIQWELLESVFVALVDSTI